MILSSFVLAGAQLLSPGRDHTVLANAISSRVAAELPLFKSDADRRRTAALLTAIAFRESSLRLEAVGDKGSSFCAFQIHASAGGTVALTTDADACVATAFAMLRTSMRVCPAHPVAWYAEGPRGCSSDRAQRISRDRMALASRIVRDVTAAEVVTPAPTGFRTPIGAAPVRWDLDPRDLHALNTRAVAS